MTHRFHRRAFLQTLASATAVGLAGCTVGANTEGSSADEPVDSPTPVPSTDPTTPMTETETPEPANEAGAGPVEVQMITDNQGSYFDPKGLLVEPGTAVRFVNVSGSHSATTYHPDIQDQPLRIPEGAESWDSGLYTNPDETFEVTLDTEGVYDYYCIPHETLGMVGRIIVGEPHGGPGTQPPESLPPAAREALPSIDLLLDQEVINGA